jgi:very-short-patch-repair endonuclease
MSDLSNFWSMEDNKKQEHLQRLHYDEQLSIPQIAEKIGTYANKVRRTMQKLGVGVKNRSETMKTQLQNGDREHPTKGKVITEETRQKIGEKIVSNWAGYDEDTRKEKGEKIIKNLENVNKEEVKKAALEGILKAAKEGSKLEKYIRDILIQEGYLIEYHKEHLIINERLHLDLFLPKLNIAIEIDGPTHHVNVFGEDVLQKIQTRDLQKAGLILGKGLVLIRIVQDRKLSQTTQRILGNMLLSKLGELKANWPDKDSRLITLKL